MRLVDLAWQNDPRLHWVSLKAESVALAADETRKAEETAERKGSGVAEKLAAKLAAEEKKKQDWELVDQMCKCWRLMFFAVFYHAVLWYVVIML